MSRPKPIQITIPHPCHQSWDEMTPQGQGRYCAHCQKTVTDFSGWSDTALYDFFAKNKGREVCGRFRAEQLNRGIVPYQPQSRLYKLFIGLGLTLALMQLPVQQTFARPPFIYTQSQQNEAVNDNNPATDTVVYVNVNGVVLDEKGKPIAGAVIRVERHNVPHYTEITECGTITGIDGSFSVRIPRLDENLNAYLLFVEHPDYSGRVISLRDYNLPENKYIEFKLRGLARGLVFIPTLHYPRVYTEHLTIPTVSEEEIKERK